MDPSSIESVLIIKPSSLGDVVHTLPALGILKKRFPHWRVRWLVNDKWAPLLEGHPDLEGLVLFPRGDCRGIRNTPRTLAWARGLGDLKPDLALDFQGLLRSALMARFSKARHILGMSDAREGAGFFYHAAAQIDGQAHAVDRYLQLASAAGARLDAGEEVEFVLPEGREPAAREGSRAGLSGDFVLLHPYSRGPGKSFESTQVASMCRVLKPTPVVLVGQEESGKEKGSLPDNVVDLVNATDLTELLWLIRRAGFVVSADSGPMHLAAAVTDRLLSVHTWTDPRKVGPYGRNCWVWKSGRIQRVGDLGAGDDSLEEARAKKISTLDEADCEAIAAFAGERIGG